MLKPTVRDSALVLLLFIKCFAPIVCWGSVVCPCFVMQYLLFFLVLLCSHLNGTESWLFYLNVLPDVL